MERGHDPRAGAFVWAASAVWRDGIGRIFYLEGNHLMRRLLSILALLLPFALVVGAERASAQTFDASLFYVEEVGDFWVYRVNGVQDSTLQVVGLETIGGVPTTLSRYTGGRSMGLKRTAALTRL